MNKDYTYSISSKKLNVISSGETSEDQVFNINEAYNNALQDAITENPEQYFGFIKNGIKRL